MRRRLRAAARLHAPRGTIDTTYGTDADHPCNTCTYAETLRWSCTKKACVSCEGAAPECAVPPDGCAYENDG